MASLDKKLVSKVRSRTSTAALASRSEKAEYVALQHVATKKPKKGKKSNKGDKK
ncbi:hypothetical protein [Campylobacter hyointestinalis]|uniref:hypothetical protein n=1 Tax=Campylobacter hyointestinalis TaxID=198 RepID=UPI001BD29252|nr:hypothetical protein [Campylobacter hyointestinalis]MBT0611974.1 hypothetical protein [Campylobacter hyointestinalis subsp. hyointestinalis]MDY2999484.1 hypothetical protein [Campylobacter hyointestinalis]